MCVWNRWHEYITTKLVIFNFDKSVEIVKLETEINRMSTILYFDMGAKIDELKTYNVLSL